MTKVASSPLDLCIVTFLRLYVGVLPCLSLSCDWELATTPNIRTCRFCIHNEFFCIFQTQANFCNFCAKFSPRSLPIDNILCSRGIQFQLWHHRQDPISSSSKRCIVLTYCLKEIEGGHECNAMALITPQCRTGVLTQYFHHMVIQCCFNIEIMHA